MKILQQKQQTKKVIIYVLWPSSWHSCISPSYFEAQLVFDTGYLWFLPDSLSASFGLDRQCLVDTKHRVRSKVMQITTSQNNSVNAFNIQIDRRVKYMKSMT